MHFVPSQGETTGDAWFNMPAPKLTPEIRRELHVLSLRSHVDRARKYKKGSEIQKGKWPKFFQVRNHTRYTTSNLLRV